VAGVRFVSTPQIEIEARWVGDIKRIVSNVDVTVQGLRVLGMTTYCKGSGDMNLPMLDELYLAPK
jgi:hypothetical protein